ncbi:hypothetical protein [Brevibacillus sp. HB2.2]|uniref:hypothetical protein n=1 Tax=Brevibacillus sp. HB2.2 TaxID=2738846 RepID=UPI00156BBF48|nr:hypothetical protein [Brevibacillus sp. HB2.2]NRS50975.1 hypothetical protein [Brevibacillus sp. HB2.2]
MRFRVQIGTVKHNGVFHEKGAIFNANKKDVAHLIGDGAVSVFTETDVGGDVEVGSDEVTNEDSEQDEHSDDNQEIVFELNTDELIVDAPQGRKGKDE